MINLHKQSWCVYLIVVLMCSKLIIATNITHKKDAQSTTLAKKRSDFSTLFKKRSFAKFIVPYVIPTVEHTPEYSRTFPNFYWYLNNHPFPDYHDIFSNYLTDSYFYSSPLVIPVIEPLLACPVYSQRWFTFLTNEFRALVAITAEKEKRSTVCIQQLHFYHRLVNHLDPDQVHNYYINLRCQQLFINMQKIVYDHVQKFNGWKNEFLFYEVSKENLVAGERTIAIVRSPVDLDELLADGFVIINGLISTEYAHRLTYSGLMKAKLRKLLTLPSLTFRYLTSILEEILLDKIFNIPFRLVDIAIISVSLYLYYK